MTARHCIVHGRVQGVFYRNWTAENARELGLAGWVRNLPDGTVEAYLEGEAPTIAEMVARMRGGPPRASVERIEQREVESKGMDGFNRR